MICTCFVIFRSRDCDEEAAQGTSAGGNNRSTTGGVARARAANASAVTRTDNTLSQMDDLRGKKKNQFWFAGGKEVKLYLH